LGGHGRDHEWLDWVDRRTVDAELRASVRWLARFGAAPWPFAYPFGAPPPRAERVLAAAGFSAAFLAGSRRREGIDPRYAIPRHDGETVDLSRVR
ncbi:MAG TPA: polysaccharide deacetylase family protein, partial [Candidatus Limnocylindrales bacterium]|nr:polysaccharide deacetylase family protein [Candidatus Limnocylindrales bacterium]